MKTATAYLKVGNGWREITQGHINRVARKIARRRLKTSKQGEKPERKE